MKKFILPTLLLLTSSCADNSIKEARDKDAHEIRLCMIAGMHLMQSPLLQEEIVKSGILSPEEMEQAVKGNVTNGADKCQAYIAYNSFGALQPKETSNNFPDGRSELYALEFNCNQENSNLCPNTKLIISHKKIVQIIPNAEQN